jgi:hypothetical protein
MAKPALKVLSNGALGLAFINLINFEESLKTAFITSKTFFNEQKQWVITLNANSLLM